MSTSSPQAPARILCLLDALHGDSTVVQDTTIEIGADGIAEVPLDIAALLTTQTDKSEKPLFAPADEAQAQAIASWKRGAVPSSPRAAVAQELYDPGARVVLTIPHLAGQRLVAPDNQEVEFDGFGMAEVGEKTARAMEAALADSLGEDESVTIELQPDEGDAGEGNATYYDEDREEDDEEKVAKEAGAATGLAALTPAEKAARTRAANAAKTKEASQK